jgi:hypothetical protein
MLATNENAVEQVKQAHLTAMNAMQKAGFGVNNIHEIVLDPQLPFMGYTSPHSGGFRIVVSKMAVDSGMLEGLLVHEMSHAYRMNTNHPSHNNNIIAEVIAGFGKRIRAKESQQKVIHELVNHIEDLYADDIAVKVFREGRLVPDEQLSTFFQSWVKDEPVKSRQPEKDRWVNAAIMVNNARALAQLKRHIIADLGGKANASNERFLSQLPAADSSQFPYFMGLMANLEEDMTEEGYRRLLKEYLNRFLEMAEGTEQD